MAGRSSNWDRIARMAAEAEAARKEKAAAAEAKKAAKARTGGTRKTTAKKATGRIKVVWTLCDQAGRDLRTEPYSEEKALRAEAKALTESTGKPHFVRRDEVPYEG